jgi:ribosome-binding factor A
MAVERTDRLNSLLREVISDVIHKEVKNPHLGKFVTVTQVEITKDLRHAKVHISVLGADEEKKKSLEALNQAAGFIAISASQQVRMRFFPELRFFLDESAEKAMHIEKLIQEVQDERDRRSDDP